ncbi:TonB-dependent siderophore receptor [Psychrobacter sp. FDAARGOS_221]|uniref:TonB-dependent siderophore receptor n=1 Tax=Psychrobacter sp. FDAARGOS_221 TaxID=1975705 RepID=UPI000BB53761|nr:TonB-dependent siderophore receptor [Psychrobacter sp. FDAARGOS_221]PNK59834.1 TonB-dependent siderophore receptor [Psychrobacter sp. FDAARGOS_221]
MPENQRDRLTANAKPTVLTNTKASSAATSPATIVSTRKPSLSKLLIMASAVPLSSMTSMAMAVEQSTTQAGSQSESINAVTDNQQISAPHITLDTTVINARPPAEFKANNLQNQKYTQPLVDVPQTVTVLDDRLIEEQKAGSLIDALRNTPGITMQMGENANSTEGDAISMRGFSGNSLFLVDGVRQVGAVNRDTFNVESIEVTKGLAGAEIGRGATGGAINIISKKPKSYEDYQTEFSIDSEGKARAVADLNRPFNDDLKGRLNLMYEKGDAVKRDEVDVKQFGIAPSITWDNGGATRVTASAEMLRSRNTPETGIPTIGMDGYFYGRTDYTVDDFDFSEFDYSRVDASTPEEVVAELNSANAARNAAPKVNDKNYYGMRSDYEDIDSDVFSVFVEHDLDDDIQLTNTTRYSKTTMDRRSSAPYIPFNIPLNIRRGTNKLEVYDKLIDLNVDKNDPSTWRVSAIRQGVDRENTTLANMTNINILDFQTGALSHDISTGIEFIKENQKNNGLTYPSLDSNFPSLYHPDPGSPQVATIANGTHTKGETKTMAAYLFDTIALNEQWDVMLGGRLDKYKTDFTTRNANGEKSTLKDEGTLHSYKSALVFKPTKQSSIYASYGRTETPPGSENFTFGTTGRNAANPNANPIFDPQKTKSWEIGSKWNVLDERLLLGLAYYHTTHEDELAELDENRNYVQFGKRQIKGIEFTAQGEITPDWRVNLGIQTMDTEIKKGSVSGPNSVGASSRWSPELTGTLWTSYDYNDKLTLGGGVRYVDEQKREANPDADLAQTSMPVIPDYWAFDVFASYRFNDAFSADLNINNVFDKDYLESVNILGYRAIKGEPLNAMLTLKYQF